jgi:hypothetical protein
MLNIFLETMAMTEGEAVGLFALLAGMIVAFLAIALVMYVFTSLIFFSLAKKAKQDAPGLAWIPIIGPAIVAYKASGMHWWPFLLLIGVIVPVIGSIAVLAFQVFFIIWMWKLFEAIKRPGWWAILLIIPLVNLVIMILAAWTDVGIEA